MEIIIGKTAGFCFGVSNAVTKTQEILKQKENVYCLGELVHNKQVTESLIEKGIKFIDNIEEAKEKVIIRAHGVAKQVYEIAEKSGTKIIDLTCPKVLHIHNIAEEYAKNNHFIFLTGEAKHPEMLGTISFCGESYFVIENEEQVNTAIEKFKKSNKKKALIISQTTYSLEKFQNIVETIKKNIPLEKIEIKNTICNATKQRQEETEEMAKQVETMIIIGGKHSSNTNKLYELAKKHCKNVLFIETEKEIKEKEIKNNSMIGIMAGASTPEDSIKKVVEKLKKI